MNGKVILNLEVELKDVDQVKQLNEVLAIFSGSAVVNVPDLRSRADLEPTKADVEPVAEAPVKPIEEKPKRKRRTRAEIEAEKAAKEEAEKKANAEPAPTEDAPEVSLEDLRALVAAKVKDFRAEIKAELTRIGAANIRALDAGNYGEFKTFLEALK